MAEDRYAGPALLLLSGRSDPAAPTPAAAFAKSVNTGRGGAKPTISRHARRVAIPSLSLAAAPLVHWTPSAARPGDAFRWAGSMLSLCERGDPFVLLQHGGLRDVDVVADGTDGARGDRRREGCIVSASVNVADSGDDANAPAAINAPAAMWQPYAAWLGKHRSQWQAACRGVIVVSSEIVTRVEARNDAQSLFGEGTRVVVVSQEALAHQLARVFIAERHPMRGNAGADVVARGSM